MSALAQRLQESLAVYAEKAWTLETKLAAASTRLRLPELLAALRERGFQPDVAYTWRGLSTQDALLAKEQSTLRFSLHNTVDAAGRPTAFAADVFDRRFGWGAQASGFWPVLGELGKSLGLEWGGDWTGFPDPGHVQVAAVSLRRIATHGMPLILGVPQEVSGPGGYAYRIYQTGRGTWIEVFTPNNKHRVLSPTVDKAVIAAILAEVTA